jgi:hypothetical protein
MLTELQQKRVWEGMLGAEIRSDYFAELAAGYLFRQKTATLLTLLFSSGAVISLLTSLPAAFERMRLVLACITAGISLYSFVMQNQKLAFDATDLHARWNRLAHGYQRLWENMYDSLAVDQLNELDDRAIELSKAGTSFPNKEKAMLRWTNRVISQHQSQHQAHA